VKLAYVAGPYRADTDAEVDANISDAASAALELWRAGYAVICPHLNGPDSGDTIHDSVWLEGDLVILRRCDLVVPTERAQDSEGARAELAEARRLGIPVVSLADAIRAGGAS
jgi:hypothetical protein